MYLAEIGMSAITRSQSPPGDGDLMLQHDDVQQKDFYLDQHHHCSFMGSCSLRIVAGQAHAEGAPALQLVTFWLRLFHCFGRADTSQGMIRLDLCLQQKLTQKESLRLGKVGFSANN